jgi:glycosyltransferase involved in cell wall biosynthesis
MKVLFQSRPDLFQAPGGDSVQVIETMAALREMAVEVDLDLLGQNNPVAYDLVHVFNLNRIEHTWPLIKRAWNRKVPVVLSPIYWSKAEFLLRGSLTNTVKGAVDLASRRLPLKRSFFIALRDRITGLQTPDFSNSLERGYEAADQRAAMRVVDCILPNSAAEALHLRNQFGFDPRRVRVVPNGVRPEIARADREIFLSEYGKSEYVLSCARIEERKNTLRLIRACVKLNLPLVLVGRVLDTPFSRKFQKKCKNEATKGDVTMTGELPYGNDLLFSAYHCARVHALPSWYETPGLSSLEAAAAGCNVVSTNRGSAYEYFGDLAWYCDPSSNHSIRAAVDNAFRTPKRPELRDHVLRNFAWKRVAELTLESYNYMLEECFGWANRAELEGKRMDKP